MSTNSNKTISILFALMIIILPMGWILISNEPPGPFYPTSTDQVESVIQKTGFEICDKTETHWKIHGAQGGYSVLVSDDCSCDYQKDSVYIHTQNFATGTDRDFALEQIQDSIQKNALNGAVFTFGSFIIVVQGLDEGKPLYDMTSAVRDALLN